MTVRKGGADTQTSVVVKTPARQKRDRRRRAAEDARWAAMNGPVEVRRVAPGESTR